METWQFSLFFVALLVGIVVLHVRVVRFEEYLRELGGLRSIDARLQTVAQTMPQVDLQRLERIEALLQRLHEDLEDLREATQHVQDAVVHIPPPAPAIVAASNGTPDLSSGERIVSAVEGRLFQMGYSNLRILTDQIGRAHV